MFVEMGWERASEAKKLRKKRERKCCLKHLLWYAHVALCLFKKQFNKIKPQLHFPFGYVMRLLMTCASGNGILLHTQSLSFSLFFPSSHSSLSISQFGKWAKWGERERERKNEFNNQAIKKQQ